MGDTTRIRTTTVGSYPVPDWLVAAPSEQALVDATRVVLATQEQSGIDVVCDGELYRFDINHPETNGMIEYFVRPLENVRSRVVLGHMRAGVTFLLPDSVLIDVDVRIGSDTTIYPGVVLEGQTTIGGETVLGPGVRVIDSWIGSGVEMKGWNYVAHTSVRNDVSSES